MPNQAQPSSRLAQLLHERILILDGAMGTMIQRYRLGEADYRGERFKDWPSDLKGNNDLLVLTKPAVIREIHEQYLEAGADILETNTFNGNRLAQADYGLQDYAPRSTRPPPCSRGSARTATRRWTRPSRASSPGCSVRPARRPASPRR